MIKHICDTCGHVFLESADRKEMPFSLKIEGKDPAGNLVSLIEYEICYKCRNTLLEIAKRQYGIYCIEEKENA